MTEFDPTDEHVYTQQAGLSYSRMLATLTTAPAARWGAAARTGRIAAGLDADLVVIERDPAEGIRVLGRVRMTMRGGRVIYRKGT
jgi:imidazolonepropionase-like amidohydrolase